ncbi:MAG: outer membrane beta-barrel protein [Rickettsia endosymbiont of Pseudomimeciton antennatum]|nr:outer membrane beta-barrel protein [Rickettsia endosymbiont of Pseudomimeciton antennatum]MCC8398397.1 outer membrane beta-barrel protein [Rickettsia endosymbiont of Labidopullus appendiculatus]
MKKLFLVAATGMVLLTSAASFAEVGHLYVKVEGGASKLSTEKFEGYNEKIKSNIDGIFGVGIGYYIMDNVRTELTLNFLTNPEFKVSDNIEMFELKMSEQGKTKGNVKSLLLSGYVDLYDGGTVKLFVGAGIGMAQVKEKTTGTVTIGVGDEKVSGTASGSSKNTNNFAYQVTIGTSFNLANAIKLDLAYSWRDYGETKPGKINLKIKDMDMNIYSGKASRTPYRGHNLMAGIRFDI